MRLACDESFAARDGSNTRRHDDRAHSPFGALAWIGLATALAVAPGPDAILVASHAARGGFARGLLANLGIQAGGVWYACLFGFGVLNVLAMVPALFAAIKIAGAAYLAWIGFGFLRSAAKRASRNDDGGAAPTLSQPFLQGLLTNILNPKVALFYLAALSQFVASGPTAPLAGALLIAIHYLIGALWLSLVAYGASKAGAFTWSRAIVRAIEGLIGAFFLAVAARLAASSTQ
jgi:threonine/homoserine/homoserine lactone efflux protein